MFAVSLLYSKTGYRALDLSSSRTFWLAVEPLSPVLWPSDPRPEAFTEQLKTDNYSIVASTTRCPVAVSGTQYETPFMYWGVPG